MLIVTKTMGDLADPCNLNDFGVTYRMRPLEKQYLETVSKPPPVESKLRLAHQQTYASL